MKLLEINLATRPARNNTLYWAGFGSAAVALAVLSVWNVWLFLGHGTTMRQRQEEFTQKDRKREELARDERRLSLKLSRLDFKGLSEQAEFANDAIRRRAFSWTRLFNRLEEVVPPTVMMVAIRPEIQADGISIVAEGSAKEQEGLLSFEENLIQNRHFSRIYPGSERREQRGQDIKFSLKFDYVPEGRPDLAGGEPAEKKEEAAPKKETPPPAQAEASGKPKGGAASKPAPPKIAAGSPAAGPQQAKASSSPAPATVKPPAEASSSPAPATGKPPAEASSSPAPATVKPPAKASSSPAPVTEKSAAPKTQAGAPAGRLSRATPPGGRRIPPQSGPGPLPPQKAGGNLLRKSPSPPTSGPEARRHAEEEAAARFANRPLQDVFNYLMKYRSMTFVFAGDFDLRQKVSMDLNHVEEPEIVNRLSKLLNCSVARQGPHAYRLSPKPGAGTLEEPPVEEEPAPPVNGGTDSGTEPPR